MLRRIFSIAFLSLLLVSGSGISYLLSMHAARKNARRFESDILSEANSFETITLSRDEFNSLPKEKISSTIFEITYQNRRFDIYKTELKENSIVLFARHDKQEEQILKNLAAGNNNKNINKQPAPFYAFHFFLPEKINFNSPTTENIFNSISWNINFMNYSSVVTPPPDNVFA